MRLATGASRTKRVKVDDGLSARARRNIQWIESNLKVPEGKLVGQPVRLSPAQKHWVEVIYGSPTRTFICSLPRKNGKTSFSAMILLLHLVGPEAVANGQLYSCAQSRDQASVLFSLAAKMVRFSAELSEYVGIRDTAKQLYCKELGTLYRALSADASTAMGLSPSLVVHDEIGQVRGPRSELYEAMETASAAQEQPLSILISTQAATDGDLFSLLIDDAMSGADPRIKCVLYEVPRDADVFDMDVVAKAQPNWHLMNHGEVQKTAADAKRMPSMEASYRNLICNQRIEMHSPFISRSVWEQNAGECDPAVFDHEPTWVGIDLSARNDLTAMILVAFSGGSWHVEAHFWTPDDSLRERSKRDRAPYDVWAGQGYIHAVPGVSIDYEFVARDIAERLSSVNVASVAFDRWRFDLLVKELSAIGVELPLLPFGQGFRDMAPAIDILETALLNQQVLHSGHPVLTMCMANARIEMDAAGNRKLSKTKATGRIDGAVALTMAMGAAGKAQEGGGDLDGFLAQPLSVL